MSIEGAIWIFYNKAYVSLIFIFMPICNQTYKPSSSEIFQRSRQCLFCGWVCLHGTSNHIESFWCTALGPAMVSVSNTEQIHNEKAY